MSCVDTPSRASTNSIHKPVMHEVAPEVSCALGDWDTDDRREGEPHHHLYEAWHNKGSRHLRPTLVRPFRIPWGRYSEEDNHWYAETPEIKQCRVWCDSMILGRSASVFHGAEIQYHSHAVSRRGTIGTPMWAEYTRGTW